MDIRQFIVLFICLSFASDCLAQGHRSLPNPSENFPFYTQLDQDGNYYLYWKFNATHITFETHVRTKGYVGFGFSPNGNMYPSDVVIGWVKNGVSYFKDRHATEKKVPEIDASQDWFLLHGEENDFGTVLKMVRKLETCDRDDMKISNDTIRAIYSYNPHDPLDENIIPYHGTSRRGSKSLMLLTQTKPPPMPADAVTKDYLNHNYHVPANDTTYSCNIFPLSDITSKHHIIKFEPIVQKGHETLIHHLAVHKCSSKNVTSYGKEYVCYSGVGGPQPCGSVIGVWAVGGQPFYFPDDVGLPIGEPGDTDVLVLEIHYNNPGLRSDFVDNSGVRYTLTKTLRPHDAGLLITGAIPGKLQIIPPNIKDYRLSTFCTEECLNKGLSKFKTGVNVFAVFQHAHLLGRGIRTRLYRHGIEQEPLAYDEHYDFNYQDFRYLHKPRKLTSGDALVVECKYDSTGRSDVTFGGFSTRDEMCNSFIFYYPRMDVDICETQPMFDNINPDPAKAVKVLMERGFHNKSDVDFFMQKLNTTHQLEVCMGRRLNPPVDYQYRLLPRPILEYHEPSSCTKDNRTSLTTPLPHMVIMKPYATPTPTENYPYRQTLDAKGNYILFWKANTTHITFEVHVRTLGYVGFGFSSNGNMFPGDVIIGWIKDGKVYFKDRHSEGHYTPAVDASQDWFLLHGEENDFGTVLKMVRKLDTCDKDDMKITNDTIRTIFSYHPDDPVDENSIPYHGPINRGTKSLMLLTQVRVPDMPPDAVTKDYVNDNYHVPGNDTTYACRIFSLADIKSKHHVIKFEPIVQKGHEGLIHHVVLNKCPSTNITSIGYEYLCHYGPGPQPCGQVFAAYAVGSQPFYYPDDAGMPIGEPGDTDVFILETHYNNPGLRNDFVDSSGVRLIMTPTLRRHDAAILAAGIVPNVYHMVPPHLQDYRVSGFCTEECLSKGLSKFQSGVNVFAVFQHAHLLARGIRTRVYRHGIEQEPFAFDEHYDFNYQDFIYLHKPRKLMSGDSLVVECKYDSSGRSGVTFGGYSTREEMCNAFVLYYPRMDVDSCESFPAFDNVNPDMAKAVRVMLSLDLNNQSDVDFFRKKLNSTHHLAVCTGTNLNPTVTYPYSYLPQPKVEYHKPSSCPKEDPRPKSLTLNPNASSTPTELYPYQQTLDSKGNYIMYWKVNTTHITFEVHVRTHGYVGFGLSPNGDMYPADVVIGGVRDGHPYFKDRHTVAHSEPLIDSSQDWYLLHAEENDFGTVLKMVRKLDTCDSQDYKITDATVRVIYSYHPDDPQGERGLPYHGSTRRGAKSLMLLSKVPETRIPKDVITRDLLYNKFHVPAVSTFYHCKVFDFSDLGKKHHLVRFDPIIQKENVDIVHHMVLYKCPGIDKSYVGKSYDCNNPPVNSLYTCNVFYLAWAVGGQSFNFPEGVGLPFADPNDSSLFILETHFNNPTLQSGHVDNSGLRLYLTPTLQRHEAGVLTAGADVYPSQIVPPHEPAFISTSFCTENCLKQGLSVHRNGVNVFAILQHAHLLARGIKTRLIRKGVEQEPLADDKHYDFNYQDIRRVTNNRTLEAGDAIVVECTYDSTDKPVPTYGGLATSNEMCLSFIYYYPSMSIETCESSPNYDDMHIPRRNIIQMTYSLNWKDPGFQEKFKQSLANTNYTAICMGRTLQPSYQREQVQIPVSRYPYIPPKSQCDNY